MSKNIPDKDILLQNYSLADAQIQMRINQRDNFGIQMILTFGAIFGALSIQNTFLTLICLFISPLVSFYFCNQVFSSYKIHDKLVYYLNSEVIPNLRLYSDSLTWESFSKYDRRLSKNKTLGSRKHFFMVINSLMPLLSGIIFCFLYHKNNLLFYLGVAYFVVAFIVSVFINFQENNNYENMMFDNLSKCSYIDKKRLSDKKEKLNRAVFLDRDGTIHIDKVETRKLSDLEFFPDTIESLHKLQRAGYDLVIITNQSGIGKGHYAESEMQSFNEELARRLTANGIKISAIYYCPHVTEDSCLCKKPKPGMFKRAEMELGISLKDSYCIGDQYHDALAGRNAGVKHSFIVKTGLYSHGEPTLSPGDKEHMTICDNLTIAVDQIISETEC